MEKQHLRVLKTIPDHTGQVPANKPILVQFDRYLSLNSVISSGATLTSGEAQAAIELTYDPVDKALVAKPRRNLRVGLGYRFTLPTQELRGMDGSSLSDEIVIDFRADALDPSPSRPTMLEESVLSILEGRCSCHGPEPLAFPNLLDLDSLIDRPSQRQPNRILIQPGQPLDSYLIQRILPQYPGVLGPEKELDKSEMRILIDWVSSLAGR